MPNLITITNTRSTPTTLLVDGTLESIAGNGGTLSIDEGALTRLLADPIGLARFRAGDLTHTTPPASGGAATRFSALLDLTVGATTNLVPAVAGRIWTTTQTRVVVVLAGGGVTAAELQMLSSGTIVQGFTIGGTFQPLVSFFGWSTAAGAGVDLQVTTPATGGALTATVEVVGSYI